MSTLKVSTIEPLDSDTTNTITIGSSGDTIAFAGTVSGVGITVVDQWYMDTGFTGGGDVYLTQNWTTSMGYSNAGVLGSAVTQSSGQFSFPSTGIYHIDMIAYLQQNQSTEDFIMYGQIDSSTDSGSNWNAFTSNVIAGNGNQNNLTRFPYYLYGIFDVTNISTFRIRFGFKSIGTNTNVSAVRCAFKRLGDT